MAGKPGRPRQLLRDPAIPLKETPSVTLHLPPPEHAFCMAHGGMAYTMRRALAELMAREADPNPVELQMRNYVQIGALLVADVTQMQQEWAAAKSLQKRTAIRKEFDELRARVAELTRYDPPK